MATQFDISAPVEKLMSVMAKLEALDSEVATPHRLEPEPRCPWDFSGATELTLKQLLMAGQEPTAGRTAARAGWEGRALGLLRWMCVLRRHQRISA